MSQLSILSASHQVYYQLSVRSGNLIPFYLIALAIFLTDQFSKAWVSRYLDIHGPTIVTDQFTLTETYNSGIGFGFLQGTGPVVGWLTLGIVLGFAIWLARTPASQWLVRAGIALTMGGALGNMVDRMTVGQVLDFMQTPWWPRVFNFADVAIRLGVVLMLFGLFWQRDR